MDGVDFARLIRPGEDRTMGPIGPMRTLVWRRADEMATDAGAKLDGDRKSLRCFDQGKPADCSGVRKWLEGDGVNSVF